MPTPAICSRCRCRMPPMIRRCGPPRATEPAQEFSETQQMKLHWSPRSPFVRKVMIVLYEAGLEDRVTLVRTPVAMDKPNPDLVPDNPLIKLPTLVLDDGTAVYDS